MIGLVLDFESILDEFNKMYLKGKYNEVLDQLNELLENPELKKEEIIKTKILKGKVLFHLSWFDFQVNLVQPALIILEEASKESKNLNNKLIEFDSIFWMFLPLYHLNKFNEIEKYFQRLSLLLKEIETNFPSEFKQKKARYLIFRAFLTFFKIQLRMEISSSIVEEMIEDLQQSLELSKEIEAEEEINFGYRILGACYSSINQDKSLEYWQKSQEINLRWENKYITAFCYTRISLIYGNKRELEKFHEYHQKSREIYNEIGSRRGIIEQDFSLGQYYSLMGDRKKAIKLFEDCLDFYLEENNKRGISNCYTLIGRGIYMQWGEQEKALEYLMKAYRIDLEMNDFAAFDALAMISEIHLIKGELDEALRIREEILDVAKKYGNKAWIAGFLALIGDVYWQMGKKQIALDYVKEGLKIREELGIKISLVYSYGHIVYIAVESDELDIAKDHFERLKTIVEELNTKPEEQYLRVLEAFLLKKSTKISDLIQAEVILEQLLKEELEYILLIRSILCLCEVLISQLKLTNDEEILKKFMKYLSRLYTFAESNKAYPLKVEVLWLQSQIALIETNNEKAKEFLAEANQIAKKIGLGRLEKKLSQAEGELNEKINLIANLSENDSSISKRMEIIKLNGTMTEIKKERLVDIQQEQHTVVGKLFSLKI